MKRGFVMVFLLFSFFLIMPYIQVRGTPEYNISVYTISSETRPLADVTITLDGSTNLTDEDGIATVYSLMGLREITFSKEGYHTVKEKLLVESDTSLYQVLQTEAEYQSQQTALFYSNLNWLLVLLGVVAVFLITFVLFVVFFTKPEGLKIGKKGKTNILKILSLGVMVGFILVLAIANSGCIMLPGVKSVIIRGLNDGFKVKVPLTLSVIAVNYFGGLPEGFTVGEALRYWSKYEVGVDINKATVEQDKQGNFILVPMKVGDYMASLNSGEWEDNTAYALNGQIAGSARAIKGEEKFFNQFNVLTSEPKLNTNWKKIIEILTPAVTEGLADEVVQRLCKFHYTSMAVELKIKALTGETVWSGRFDNLPIPYYVKSPGKPYSDTRSLYASLFVPFLKYRPNALVDIQFYGEKHYSEWQIWFDAQYSRVALNWGSYKWRFPIVNTLTCWATKIWGAVTGDINSFTYGVENCYKVNWEKTFTKFPDTFNFIKDLSSHYKVI